MESLARGLREHVGRVRRRVPGADVILQIDEPSLPAVLSGAVRTASGLNTYRSVSAQVARDALTAVAQAAPTIFHCCAPGAPLTLFREAGAAGIAIDLDLVELDPLGEAIDAGLALLAGVAPDVGRSTARPPPRSSNGYAERGGRSASTSRGWPRRWS